ncbi:MAG: DUF4190 domain-containing protein [Phycisphaerales bacterium JB063]
MHDPEAPLDTPSPPTHTEAGPAGGVPGAAVGALVLGVAGVLTSFAVVPGAICGVGAAVLAKRAAEQTGPDARRPGRGYAVAGQAAGGLALLLSAVFGLVFAMGVMNDVTRTPARRMQNSTQLRGTHQGLMTLAHSNNNFFPGLDAKGNILLDSLADTGLSGDGDTAEARYWILLVGQFIAPSYAISPRETDSLVTEYARGTGGQSPNPVVWDNKTRHYSYAMLSIEGHPEYPPVATGRLEEWQQSLNTQAIVMSDRNLDSNASNAPRSLYAPDFWQGSVLWNDNHVSFKYTHYFETRYGNGATFIDQGHGDAGLDNLFANDTDPGGNTGNDALMVHDGD